MEAFKRFEYFVQILFVKADPIVLDPDFQQVFLNQLILDGDPRRNSFSAVFEAIRNKVLKQLAHLNFIGLYAGQRFCLHNAFGGFNL